MTRKPGAGGDGFATRSTAEVRTIMKTRRNDRRTSMDHLDETAFTFECAEAQRSISFLEVSGYACVSFSLNFCAGPGASRTLRAKAHRAFSSGAWRKPSHKTRAASAPVPRRAERPLFGMQTTAPARSTGPEVYCAAP